VAGAIAMWGAATGSVGLALAARRPPLVAAAVSETSPHILIEGHTRATAFVRAMNPDDEVEVIVGYSAALPTWGFYGNPSPDATPSS
jgi:hypothetical protein